MNGLVEIVAHRAGNDPRLAAAVRRVADTVEVDVHLVRGRLVVRHAKRLLGTGRLWERWYLLPRGTLVPTLPEALAWLPADQALWIDAKGPFALRLPTSALSLVGPGRAVTVSGKVPWVLARAPFGVRRVRSVASRAELAALLLLPGAGEAGVALHDRLATRARVARLQRRWQVFVWDVGDERRARELAAWGVSGLILDSPELMATLRA